MLWSTALSSPFAIASAISYLLLMKKKLLKSLKDIEKHLKAEHLASAFSQIRSEIENLSEIIKVDKIGTDDFQIPENVKGIDHQYIIYSDGACRGNPGPGSYGLIVQDSDENILFESSEVFAETTNNRMEMLGVINGFKLLGQKMNKEGFSITKIKVLVVTDSKYVIDGVTKWMEGWKKAGWKRSNKKPPENVDLWKTMDLYKEKIGHLDFEWVKGHAGHPQNEYCDQLANKALDHEGY